MNTVRVYLLGATRPQFEKLGFSNRPASFELELESESGRMEAKFDKEMQAFYLEFKPSFDQPLPGTIEKLISNLGCRTRFTTRVLPPQSRLPGLYRLRSARLDVEYCDTAHEPRTWRTWLAEAVHLGDLLELVHLFKEGVILPEPEYGTQIEAPAKTWQRLLHEAWILLRLKVANLRWRIGNYASGR